MRLYKSIQYAIYQLLTVPELPDRTARDLVHMLQDMTSLKSYGTSQVAWSPYFRNCLSTGISPNIHLLGNSNSNSHLLQARDAEEHLMQKMQKSISALRADELHQQKTTPAASPY